MDGYLYEVGYHSYEDSYYHQFLHAKKFNEAELEEELFAVLRVLLSEKREPDSEYEHEQHPSFADLIIDFEGKFVAAMKSRGFSPAKFTTKLSVFGWAKSDTPGDWRQGREEEDITARLQKRLQESLQGGQDEQ